MRLPEIAPEQLSAESRKVLAAILDGPRRAQLGDAGLVGPFGVWVRAPALGGPTEALGAAVRFGSSLADNVREVAICTVGHFHRARFEFAAHREMAVAAGVDDAALERLRRDEPPGFEGDEALAHELARTLLEVHRLGDEVYARALAAFGETALIELVMTIGYYCLVSHTLNAFEIPLGPGMTDPYPGLPA
ncbi:MAG: carboxymuconolactone decarboxylase family protein [Gammaproteobacteria bacterium]